MDDEKKQEAIHQASVIIRNKIRRIVMYDIEGWSGMITLENGYSFSVSIDAQTVKEK